VNYLYLSMFIYLVTNTINGKAYIGKTSKTVKGRWETHLQNAKMGLPYHLYRAIRKYGVDAFHVQTIAECNNSEQLSELEKMWILLLGTHSTKYGYNMTYGGEGVTGTEEVREKIRQKAMGRIPSKKQRAVASALFKGKPKPIIQRKKMAAWWDETTPIGQARRSKQALVARRVNDIENKKLKDYLCPDCGNEFEQVTKGVYGGHRKACLHWKRMSEIVEEEIGLTLDEVLDS